RVADQDVLSPVALAGVTLRDARGRRTSRGSSGMVTGTSVRGQEQSTMVSKEQAAAIVRDAQFQSGTTWTQIAEAIGRPAVWTVAALLGQHPMSAEEASTAGELLGLDDDVVRALQLQPYRGSGKQGIPTDPTVYRLYEAVDVYGAAIKELI